MYFDINGKQNKRFGETNHLYHKMGLLRLRKHYSIVLKYCEMILHFKAKSD